MSDLDATTGGGGADAASPKQLATAAVQTVKQEVASFAASAQEKALEHVDQKKDTAAQTLGDFASAIRRAGDELAQNDQSLAGRVVKQAADGLESLTHSLSDKRPEELFDAARDFGRRNPGAFVAGALLVGLAVGRFMRSSANHGDRDGGSRSQRADATDPTAESGLDSGGEWQRTMSETALEPDGSTEGPGFGDDGRLDRPGRFGSGV